MYVGGLQAIAATRGDGKSSIMRIVGGFWGILYGLIKYIVLLGANGEFAEGILDDIKDEYETNAILYEDFPEVCHPIRALEGAPARAKGQTIDGVRTNFKWSGKHIRMPIVGGSAASGAIITTRGVDSAIRGLVRKSLRPDLVLCDDIETRESANSFAQTEARGQTIRQDVLGLSGPGKKIAVGYLCTISRKDCLSDQLTDRQKNPAWHGLRQKFLLQTPNREDLWETYTELRIRDQLNNDNTARRAHAFYMENRAIMDAGGVVNNPHRFKNILLLQDDTLLEVSALQHAYNLIADMGWEAFAAEYQNEPIEQESTETSGLTATAVQKRCSGKARGLVPTGTDYLTAGIDIGGRLLFWVVTAWKKGLIGHIVDYGTEQIHSPLSGKLTDPENRRAVEDAIFSALMGWRDWTADGWQIEAAAKKQIDVTLIDAGWMDTAIYNFVKGCKSPRYRASKGYGSVERAKFNPPTTPGAMRRFGHKYWASYMQQDRIWLYHVNADYWKLTVQNGFLTPVERPGSITLWGDDPYKHKTYGKHIVSEIWKRDFVPGKGTREFFDVRDRNNHYLDATYLSAAAAAVCGVRIVGDVEDTKPPKPKLRKRVLEGSGLLDDLPGV